MAFRITYKQRTFFSFFIIIFMKLSNKDIVFFFIFYLERAISCCMVPCSISGFPKATLVLARSTIRDTHLSAFPEIRNVAKSFLEKSAKFTFSRFTPNKHIPVISTLTLLSIYLQVHYTLQRFLETASPRNNAKCCDSLGKPQKKVLFLVARPLRRGLGLGLGSCLGGGGKGGATEEKRTF